MEVSLLDVQQMLFKAKGNPRKLIQVERVILDCLEKDPDSWPLQFYLASLYIETNRAQLAVTFLQRAAALKPDIPEIWNNLGTSYRKVHLPEKAEVALKKALEIQEDPDVYNNLATLNINEGTPAEGERWARKALEMNSQHAQAGWNLALTLLEQEQWEEGFKRYIYGIISGDRIVKNYGYSAWWDGEPHPDSSLVVFGEQGIGDEIMFASCMRDLQKRFEGEVVFDCHPRLVGLFKRSFPDIPIYGTRKELKYENYRHWVDKHRPMYKIAIGDVPKHFRTKGHLFPRKTYLMADPVRVAEYKEWLKLLGDGPYIGLSWFGGHKTTRKDLRSLGVGQLEPFLDMGTVVSCQYSDHNREAEARGIQTFPEVFEASKWERYLIMRDGHVLAEAKTKEQAKDFQVQYGGKLEHHTGPGYDYDETAAFVTAIHELGGAIVSVNTSLVHLCGALGVKCFVLTPSKPAWRYGLKRKNMIWYGDHIKQYRQKGTDWAPAIEELKSELETYLNRKRKAAA